MLLKPVLLNTLESALNNYLSLDEDKSLFLTPLSGKVIAINIQPFDETFYLCPHADGIQILDDYTSKVDAQLSGTLTAFGFMALSSNPAESLFAGQVTITGDTETGQKLQRLFEKIDIDLEEQLATYTGDVLAHKIGRLLNSGTQWSKDSLHSLQLNLAEFLQEETRDLPAHPEADIFYSQVDNIRADFDRLEARVKRLSKP